jgi:hypothetical protein
MNHQFSTFHFLVAIVIESSSVEPVQLSLAFTVNIKTKTRVLSKDKRLLFSVSKTTKAWKCSQDKAVITLITLSVGEKG